MGSKPRNHGRRTVAVACALGLAALPLMVAGPAAAAIVEPAAPPHAITVFPVRDFISMEGYQPGETLAIRVVRNGVVIGTAGGVVPADGIFEVNHPGGVCWDAPATPDLLPGDRVEVLQEGEDADGLPIGDANTTMNVTAEPAVEVGTDVVIHGTAQDAAGLPVDAGLLEQRIVNPDFRLVGLARRDIRAVADGSGEGTLAYDPVDPVTNPAGTNWTATYSGLTQEQRNTAVAGQTRVLGWHSTNLAGDRLNITIYEAGEVGGPGIAGCPAGASYAVTSSTPRFLNRAAEGSPVTISGVSFDATAVTLTLDDVDPATAPFTADPVSPAPATGSQTWQVSVPATAWGAYADGRLTASGTYTVPTGEVDPVTGEPVFAQIGGADLVLLKDVVAPGRPTASPPGGTYSTSQSVTLSPAAEGDVVRYRIGATGSVPEPTAASPIANGQISVTASQTIKAASFDAAGNRSTTLTADYLIVVATPPGAPTNVTAAAGNGQATVSWTAPANDGGSAITGYVVRNVTTGGSVTVPASPTSTTVSGLTNGTAYQFEVRARNVAGDGAGALSNVVTPRTVPGAPTIGTATAGNASAVVTWTPPVSDGGSAITSYSVRVFTATGTTPIRTVSAPATATSLDVTNLTNGTAYRFKVLARNVAGAGPVSAFSNTVTPRAAATVPGAPGIGPAASGVAGGAITATATWSPPTNTGGSPITGYRVRALRMSSTGTVLAITTSAVQPATARSLQMTLTAGNYRFTVQAINAIGSGPQSARSNLVTAR